MCCRIGKESVAGGKKYCWGENVHFPPRQLVMGWEIPVRTGTKLTIRAWKWPCPRNRGDFLKSPSPVTCHPLQQSSKSHSAVLFTSLFKLKGIIHSNTNSVML